MSLLMQALKKAEDVKQKQEAAQRGDEPRAVATEPLSLTPPEAPSVADELGFTPASPAVALPASASIPAPKIEPMLEFETIAAPPSAPVRIEPIAAPIPAPSPASLSMEPPPQVAREAEPVMRTAATPSVNQRIAQPSTDAARETAKAVFASKQRADHRRVMLIGAAALLAVAIIGFGYYVWHGMMVSSSSFVTAPPASSAAPVVPQESGEPVASPAVVFLPPTETSDSSHSSASLTPSPAVSATSIASAAPAGLRASSASSENSRASTAMVPGDEIADGASIHIRAGHSENRIDPLLSSAYQMLLTGDLNGAQRKYQGALQQETNNRDALLGMASIAIRRNQMDQAERYYIQLLELDPLDPDATAGLIGMQQADPVQSESRIKKVLAQHPQAGALWFALGNVYSQQSRWAEAQQAYFRAFGNQPDNADYAFNLAVSLDRLNQDKLALEYYQKAVKLIRAGQANFSVAAVQQRVGKLQSALAN